MMPVRRTGIISCDGRRLVNLTFGGRCLPVLPVFSSGPCAEKHAAAVRLQRSHTRLQLRCSAREVLGKDPVLREILFANSEGVSR